MNKIFWFRALSLGAMAGLAGAAPFSTAHAEEAAGAAYRAEEVAPACVAVFSLDRDAAPSHMLAVATTCVATAEASWGTEDPRLVALNADLAAKLAGVPKQAHQALPFRERAYELAEAVHGPESMTAGDAALALVRTMILAGRCDGMDPLADLYLSRARAVYEASDDAARRSRGLRAVAAAYADAKFFAVAADTLSSLETELSAREWRRVADWRVAADDSVGAEQALRAGLDGATGRERSRVLHDLRVLLFERGDFEALETLPAE